MSICFFFNDTATTEIYTLSLHDALPISKAVLHASSGWVRSSSAIATGSFGIDQHRAGDLDRDEGAVDGRSEEHTSELQSRQYLVCRLLLEKNNQPLILHDSQIELSPVAR